MAQQDVLRGIDAQVNWRKSLRCAGFRNFAYAAIKIPEWI